MLNRLNYDGVPGAVELAIPESGEFDPDKITLNAVPALHFGAVLERVWVEFTEVDGAILRRDFVESGGVDKWEASVTSIRQLEYVANKLQVSYISKYDESGVPGGFLDGIADLIAEIWRVKISSQFPDREFAVAASRSDDDGPTVYLEQEDHGKPVPFRPWVEKTAL